MALTLDKDSSAVHQVMANVLADLGHVREAEGHHQRVLELSPNDAECRTTFGIFLSNTGMIIKLCSNLLITHLKYMRYFP